MSDTMLLGILRMPIDEGEPLSEQRQFVSAAREAANRIESDALEIDRLSADLAEAKALLRRCRPIIEADARMMADITRHSPLDVVSQAIHDTTEYESERLVREFSSLFGDEAALSGGEEG